MAKINQITRFCRIINRLSGLQEYIPTGDLLSSMAGLMSEDSGYSKRTLQRDINTIDEVFGIHIKYVRGRGYHIAGTTIDTSEFARVLDNYQIAVSASNNASGLQDYILPEHRTQHIAIDINRLLSAIKGRRIIRFSYTLPRLGGIVKQYTAQPYFIKQSQGRWYLLALVNENVRTFEVGRFVSLNVTQKTFTRDNSICADNISDNIFGILDDEKLPVEHIVLSISRTEWQFMKTLPIHHSQAIVSEDDYRVTLSLDMKITYDLIMDLLSRSNSITILEPEHLRDTFRSILASALKRNDQSNK